ncbi:unnamed protein product, partial [Mesorhabditis spiculigera]
MAGSQFWLLFRKDLRLMWRNKLWTVFEIVIPLILAAPLVFTYLSAEDKLAPVDYPASPGKSWQLDGMNLTCDDVIYT